MRQHLVAHNEMSRLENTVIGDHNQAFGVGDLVLCDLKGCVIKAVLCDSHTQDFVFLLIKHPTLVEDCSALILLLHRRG